MEQLFFTGIARQIPDNCSNKLKRLEKTDQSNRFDVAGGNGG